MSVSNNNIEDQRKLFVSWSNNNANILALGLLAGGLVLISPASMAALAQEEGESSAATSSGLELSPQPIWEEEATNTGATPINQTHSRVEFIGNGTMTVPDTGETVNMTNSGYGIVTGREPVFVYGREKVFSDDGGTTAITYYEIAQYDPATFRGKGIIIGVFDSNATGMLAPFNGMVVAGIHEDDPTEEEATITLWEWEGRISNSSNIASVQGESPMNITRTLELPPPSPPTSMQ